MAVETDEVGSWQELLSRHPLFEHIRLSTSTIGSEREGRKNVMCEIRGDLFVWSSHDSTLLTTNLKRIAAHPEKECVYQKLRCTHAPESPAVRLLPHPSGQYIAVQCERDISVVTLPWHRGIHGEFGGGTVEVICQSVLVARDFFIIHQDSANSLLLQAIWHPVLPFHLVLLTRQDSMLHLYSLANPNVEEFSLSLPTSPSAGLSMKDPVVAFGLWGDSVFLLQEDSNITLTPLTPYTPPQPPLLMHPQMDDDCDNEAVLMLVLPSNPCVVVIATTSGMLRHCVYLKDEEDADDASGSSKECLYIVESISFDTDYSDMFPSSLVHDPLYPHIYYVVHSEGVHQITLNWLKHMEKYTSSDTNTLPSFSSLLNEKETGVIQLLQTEPGTNWPEGVVIVSEPMLGLTLIALTSDWECVVQPLQRSESALPVTGIPHSSRRLISESQPMGQEFIEEIEKILKEGGTHLRKFSDKVASQADCYKYISFEIKRLKEKHILSQRKAKDRIEQKISSISQQKEYLISERLRIEDEIEDVAAMNEKLQQRLEHILQMCKALESRVTSLLCQQEAQSPVLSQAEEWMRDELEGFNSHMPLMHQKIIESRRKLEVCCGPGHTPKVEISERQSQAILSTLTNSGKSIKNLMEQVQGLKEVACGPLGS